MVHLAVIIILAIYAAFITSTYLRQRRQHQRKLEKMVDYVKTALNEGARRALR